MARGTWTRLLVPCILTPALVLGCSIDHLKTKHHRGLRIRVSVDAIVAPSWSARSITDATITYRLRPASAGTSPYDLTYRYVARSVDVVLQGRGWQPASDTKWPTMEVFVAYGIEPTSRERITYQLAWFDSGGIRYTTLVPIRVKDDLFLRYLILTAVDPGLSRIVGEPVPLWRTTLVSTGYADDLRLVLPALIAAAGEYLGQDTGRRLEYVVRLRGCRYRTTYAERPCAQPVVVER